MYKKKEKEKWLMKTEIEMGGKDKKSFNTSYQPCITYLTDSTKEFS